MLSVILAIFCIIFAIVYGYFWHRSRFFIRRGIPGPKPTSVFSGNLKELQTDRSPFNKSFIKWEEEYGSTFGYLEGGQKVICTSDLSILHDVFGKKFENFHSRKPIHPFPFNPDKDERANVFTARGLRWKRLRTLTSPSFNPQKLRNMQTTMLDTTRKVMKVFDELEGQEINVCKLFLESSTDVIERIAFGKEESGVGKTSNPVTLLIRAFFNPAPFIENPLINFYVGTFEFQDWTIYLHKVLVKIVGSPLTKLGEILVKTIEKRRALAVERKSQEAEEMNQLNNNEDINGNGSLKNQYEDFIDLFLNSEASEDDIKSIENNNIKLGGGELSKAKIEKRLSDQEIISMCSVLMLAGVDTTATAMSCFAYCLATNPEAQEKLIEEIDYYILEEEDINMDNVNSMQYLDWCIKESMRVLPLAGGANSRICMNTCTVGDQNLVMEEGMTLVSNFWSIHHDPKYWGDDAEEFVPERWDPELDRIPKDPYAYQPFGLGPRQCMGMRFGLLEIKLMFCHLLKNFRIEATKNTKIHMAGIIVCGPKDVTVTLRRRVNADEN
uniref:Cytochrome P450 n=1 Tax=Panagrolaimus sp. PS1159 TaxID=55785 RepID=A0AC35FDL4_9BILA